MARLSALFDEGKSVLLRRLGRGDKLWVLADEVSKRITSATGIVPGEMGEDLHIAGVELAALIPGTLLKSGEAVLQVSEKAIHSVPQEEYPALYEILKESPGLLLKCIEPAALSAGDVVSIE